MRVDDLEFRIRWFGEAWPTPAAPAPICNPEFEIPIPVGTKCLECVQPIKEGQKGVVTACSPGIWGFWRLEVDGQEINVCSYHLSCFLSVTIGGELGKSIVERIFYRGTPVEVPKVEIVDEENLQIGRGWLRKRKEEEQ